MQKLDCRMASFPDPHHLAALGRALQSRGYAFVSPTPATHRIVIDRRTTGDPGLRDIFGWNRPFAEQALPPDIREPMHAGGLVEAVGGQWRSRVRFSSIGSALFAHSAYPTDSEDAVFFGPDTYRFVRFLLCKLKNRRAPAGLLRILDLGCGSGAGGIVAAQSFSGPVELTLSDVNPRALAFSAANADIAGQAARTVESDLFDALTGAFNLIVINPPYLCDDARRLYRHGGHDFGTELPVKMIRAAIARLAPGGLLLAYTGAPVVAGRDCFWEAIAPHIPATMPFEYEEVDPDVFGEELATPAYAEVDRIAAVTLVAEG